MVTDGEKINQLHALLTDAYLDYVNQHHRKVGYNEFARYLGVNVGSFNQWMNGNRLPSYDNSLRLSMKLGPKVFDILGYEYVFVITDPELIDISKRWSLLDHDVREQIIEQIKEKTDSIYNQQTS